MMSKEERWQKAMDFCAPTCHQRSERSFFYHGWQFPVCARCTGLYSGYVIGTILLIGSIHLPLFLSVLFILIMFLDWFLQFKKVKMSTNSRRFVSGVCAGIAIMQLLGYGIFFLFGQ